MSFNERLTKAREDIQNEANEREQTRKRLAAEQERKDREEVQRQLSVRSMPEFQQIHSFATDPELHSALLSYWEHYRPSIERRWLFWVYREIPQHYLKMTCFFPQGGYNKYNERGVLAKTIIRLYHDASGPNCDLLSTNGEYQHYSGMVYVEMILTLGFRLFLESKTKIRRSKGLLRANRIDILPMSMRFQVMQRKIAASIASNNPKSSPQPLYVVAENFRYTRKNYRNDS